MRLLLDTHALLWRLEGSPRLTARAKRALDDPRNDVFVSAASLWEVTMKERAGRVVYARPGARLADAVAALGFLPLPVHFGHVMAIATLGGAHNDPFDVMLAAQAMVERCRLVSADEALDTLGVERYW